MSAAILRCTIHIDSAAEDGTKHRLTSKRWKASFSIVILTLTSVSCDGVHIHKHPEVAIVDYNGPLHQDIFAIIRGVETLEILNSNITRVDGKMAANLPKLKKIVFINCTIDRDQVDIEDMLTGATNLRIFIARHLFARELRPDIVRKLPLEVYIMTDNRYPKLPGNLFNETKLRKLDLARNHLEVIEEGAFNGLNLLETLELQTNELSSISASILQPLKNVKYINLAENKFTKFSAKDLPELPNLETLNLESNPLKELDLEGVEKIAPKLKDIKIAGSSLTEAQIDSLKIKFGAILKT